MSQFPSSRCLVAAIAIACFPGACAGSNQLVGGAEPPRIGLGRGAHWSVLALEPPHLLSPRFNLVLENHVLSGVISDGQTAAATLHVRIADDGATGRGPFGPVAMKFVRQGGGITADGIWSGRQVHLEFRRDSLRGTVADNARFDARGDHAVMRAPTTRPRDSTCEYQLDQLTPDGALAGGSICSGMPQPTRLEIPRAAARMFSPPELVTVLVALLSSPPVAPFESFRHGRDPGARLPDMTEIR